MNPSPELHGGTAANVTTHTRNSAAGAKKAPSRAPLTFLTPPRQSGLIDAAYRIGISSPSRKIR